MLKRTNRAVTVWHSRQNLRHQCQHLLQVTVYVLIVHLLTQLLADGLGKAMITQRYAMLFFTWKIWTKPQASVFYVLKQPIQFKSKIYYHANRLKYFKFNCSSVVVQITINILLNLNIF